jgi:glycopeptide antibiotics resistance protein
MLNIAGNIFAFSPFGFILPVISPKNRKFLNVALLCFEFTLSIELIQLLLKVGIFDVDDIFMNLCGGIFGYCIFAICMKIIRRK